MAHFVASCKGVLGRARAIAMDDALLNEVRAAVQAKVEAKKGDWENDDWSPFLDEVVLWLLNVQGERKKKVTAAAAGLFVRRDD